MSYDLSYTLPLACIGWFLVTLVLTPRRWKRFLAAVIAWVVVFDIIAIINTAITLTLRHSPVAYTISVLFIALPFVAFVLLLIRTGHHKRTPK